MVASNFGMKTISPHLRCTSLFISLQTSTQKAKISNSIDEELVAAPGMEELCTITHRMDEFKSASGWLYSGDVTAPDISIGNGVSGVRKFQKRYTELFGTQVQTSSIL